MLNVSDLLEQIKQSPYREIEVKAPHTGEIAFADIKPGDKVHGPQGTWKEKPGTLLATLTRELVRSRLGGNIPGGSYCSEHADDGGNDCVQKKAGHDQA